MTTPSQPTGSGFSDPVDFDGLMDEFTAALRRGERPSIEDWVERHPEHEQGRVLAEGLRE